MTDRTYVIWLLVAGVAFLAAGMAGWHMRVSALYRRLDALSRAEARIDALLKHEGRDIVAEVRRRAVART